MPKVVPFAIVDQSKIVAFHPLPIARWRRQLQACPHTYRDAALLAYSFIRDAERAEQLATAEAEIADLHQLAFPWARAN